MGADRFADAVTALAAAAVAWPALAGVSITDGDVPGLADPGDYVIIGHDGALDASGALSAVTQAGTITQAWLDMGPGSAPAATEETTGRIHCVAVSQTGDITDIPARRARVQVLMGAVGDSALAANVVNGILFDGVDEGSYIYRQNTLGCAVIGVFGLGYSAPW